MQPREVADRYFASVRARDIDDFTALFAEDAKLTLPDGRQFAGAAAIRNMEAGVFAVSSPTPSPVNVVAGEAAVAVEIEVRVADGTVHRMASFFQLDDEGRIQRLSIYRRSNCSSNRTANAPGAVASRSTSAGRREGIR